MACAPGRPGVFLGRRGRLVGDYRRGSPHHLRLRDEQDGAGRRDHRSGAGRAGERHRESLSHVLDRISVIQPPTRVADCLSDLLQRAEASDEVPAALLSPAASPWPPPTPAHRGECSPWTPASRGTGRSSRQWRCSLAVLRRWWMPICGKRVVHRPLHLRHRLRHLFLDAIEQRGQVEAVSALVHAAGGEVPARTGGPAILRHHPLLTQRSFSGCCATT